MSDARKGNKTLGSVGPKLDAAGGWTVVEVMAKDTIVHRSRRGRGGRTLRQEEARRGHIGHLSQRSRRELLSHLRNTPSLRYYVTLTYPSAIAPHDHRTSRKHLDAFLRRLVRKEIGCVWKFEFTKAGLPHVHLLPTKPVDEAWARQAWAEILGCQRTRSLVESSPIRSLDAVQWYTAKAKGDRANVVPEGYSNMGRWWGRRGPDSAPVPLARIQGTEAEVAKVVRALKAVRRANAQGDTRRDHGLYGFSLYGVGGTAMARDAMRYAHTLDGLHVATEAEIREAREHGAYVHADAAENGATARSRRAEEHVFGDEWNERIIPRFKNGPPDRKDHSRVIPRDAPIPPSSGMREPQRAFAG